MKPCIHRLPLSDTHVRCLNTVDLMHNGTVTNEVCKICPYTTESPIRGIGDVLTNVFNATGITKIVHAIAGEDCNCGKRADKLNSFFKPKNIADSKWATIVTTAPRQAPTISCSIQSIRDAGWEPTVFAEPDSIILPNVSYRNNPQRLGAWHNWLKAIRWAYEETSAEFILSVQDDSLFHPDSRSLVEAVMWPSKRTGFISLYTAKHYSMNRSGNPIPVGVNKLKTNAFWGACALVFHRNVIRMMLNSKTLQQWNGVLPKADSIKTRNDALKHRKDNPHLIQNVDSAIGKMMKEMQLDMYCIDPSPVTHISPFSAIAHGSNTGKRNCFRCADHNKPLVEQVFPNRKA